MTNNTRDDTARDGMVERLRATGTSGTWSNGKCHRTTWLLNPDGPEAAARIETLEAQKLVLEQFADAANVRIGELDAQHAEDVKRNGELIETLERINRRASPNADRTFDVAINDLMWITDDARAALNKGSK